MKQLISAILDYSRIGNKKILERFDCNEVVQNVLIDLSFSIEEAEGTINVGELPIISGYKTEFSLLVQNLIGNAIKFRSPGVPPVVKVTATSNENSFHFCVQDNGIGIEEKNINEVFTLFSRVHSREAYQGTGIGLTHSKKIVELHGGKIWVTSKKNEGTCFHFLVSKQLKANLNEKEVELYHAY